MKSQLLSLLSLSLIGINVQALTISDETHFFTTFPQDVPDDSGALTTSLNLVTSIQSLSGIKVALSVDKAEFPGNNGGVGDLLATLTFEGTGAFSVLLNQIGVNDPIPGNHGHAAAALNVRLYDLAASDIHHASGSPVTGDFQPDGRNFPEDTDRPYLLSVFRGINPNGVWTLTVSDMVSGGKSQVLSAELLLSGETGANPVPDHGVYPTSLSLIGLIGFHHVLRRRVRTV